MNYEIKGTVKVIGEMTTFASGATKQQLVVTTDGQYPQDVPMDFWKDKTEVLKQLNPGDIVSVKFDIRGNEYNGKYYANLSGWTLEVLEAASAPQTSPADEEMDDIPF